MTRIHIRINEAILLGVLALLVLLTTLAPWKELAVKYNAYENRKYSFGRLNRSPQKPGLELGQGQGPLTWRVSTEYSPKHGVLQLYISHKLNAPFKNLSLVAEFNSYRSVMPVTSAVLLNQSEGVYRAENLRLTKGDWIMSVTGRLRSEFIFRLEKLLHVS
jgi:hypothetical protein